MMYYLRMYYSYTCTYCTRLFYTYHTNKEYAARILYEGIKKHLIEYGEDDKEYEMDEDPEIETNQMYYLMAEITEPPTGGYEL